MAIMMKFPGNYVRKNLYPNLLGGRICLLLSLLLLSLLFSLLFIYMQNKYILLYFINCFNQSNKFQHLKSKIWIFIIVYCKIHVCLHNVPVISFVLLLFLPTFIPTFSVPTFSVPTFYPYFCSPLPTFFCPCPYFFSLLCIYTQTCSGGPLFTLSQPLW